MFYTYLAESLVWGIWQVKATGSVSLVQAYCYKVSDLTGGPGTSLHGYIISNDMTRGGPHGVWERRKWVARIGQCLPSTARGQASRAFYLCVLGYLLQSQHSHLLFYAPLPIAGQRPGILCSRIPFLLQFQVRVFQPAQNLQGERKEKLSFFGGISRCLVRW